MIRRFSYGSSFNRSLISAFDQVIGDKKVGESQSKDSTISDNLFRQNENPIEMANEYNNNAYKPQRINDNSLEVSLKKFLPGKSYQTSDLIDIDHESPKFIPLFRSNDNSMMNGNLNPEIRKAVDIFRRNKYSTDMLHKVFINKFI